MLRLKNNTKSYSRIGYAVTLDPRDKGAFVYAVPSSTKVLGIITEVVQYRGLCNIATQGETAKVMTIGNVVKGSTLRLGKTTENISLGVSTIAKLGDAPYLKIGDALNAGKGLISCVLELTFQGVATNTTAVVEYANNTTAIAAGLKVGEFYRTGEVLKIVY